jgi:hypothetical protein
MGRHNFLGKLWWWRIFAFWERKVPGTVPEKYSLPLPRAWRERVSQSRLCCGRPDGSLENV